MQQMGCWKKIALLILVLSGLSALPVNSWGSGPASGTPAPNFLVESGDDKKLTLDMLRGKVVVLFYEDRKVIRKNIELKNELKQLYRSQPADVQKDIFRLVVIDCSEAYWPVTPIWKDRLVENSRREGFTIYGDWNKQMLEDYRLQPGESNFIIIDKQGIIRYAAASKIENGQFEKIKGMLFSLVQKDNRCAAR
jgi:hypothetical protein